MPTYESGAVANYFLDRAESEERFLTHLKLQKLVYIAHGWHLAVTGEPLLRDPIHAWTYGPVIPPLYQQLKRYGGDPVSEKVRWWDSADRRYHDDVPDFAPETRRVLDKVWDEYKAFTAGQLSTLTHQEGTPWYAATDGGRVKTEGDRPIYDEAIRQHYVDLAGAN